MGFPMIQSYGWPDISGVMIHSKNRSRGKWSLGIIEALYTGRDGEIRGAKLRAGAGHIERPVNHLYPLELKCDQTPFTSQAQLNPNIPELLFL